MFIAERNYASSMPSDFKEYRKKEYEHLLEDPSVKRWYTNTSKGSLILADVNLRILGRFCSWAKTTPSKIAELSLEKLQDLAEDYVNELESSLNPKTKKPYSPGYVENCLTAIRSWAERNNKTFNRKIKIKNANRTPTLESERAPTADELRRVLYADTTPLRTRVSIALMAFSGPRPELQGNYLGLDGLRVKDFPELTVTRKRVSFKKMPAMIVVREELSKMKNQYITFLCEEGCELIKLYLEKRIASGEKINADSGIVVSSVDQSKRANWAFRNEDKSPFLRTTNVSNNVREAMRAVGLSWRPYVWRVYFDTTMLLAENKGLVSHAYQQFWMGHAGDIEATYTTNKHTLPEPVIEDMLDAYKKTSKYLQTKQTESKDTGELKHLFLLAAHVSEQEIKEKRLAEMGYDELAKYLEDRLSKAIDNGKRQLVVPVGEVKDYLAKGYDFAANLGNGEAVVKLPF